MGILLKWFKFSLYSALAVLAARAHAAPEKIPTVSTQTITRTVLFESLVFPTTVVSKINAVVLSESDGIVKTIRAPLGRRVKVGEVLIKILNTDPVYEYAPILVRAPLAGVVSTLEVTEGTRLTKGQKLATITDPEDVRLRMEITSGDLGLVKMRAKGEFLPAGQSESTPVEIVGVSPFLDPATGTATAELAFLETGEKVKKFLPGLVGKATFRTDERQGIQIPEQAVFYRNQKPLVRVVEDGKAKYLEVGLGQTQKGMVEITKGLQPGLEVIVRSSLFVAEGEAVKVQKAGAP